MNFEISKRARRQIERIQAWWLEHRPAARALFLEELEQADQQLRETPTLGVVYTEHRTGAVRRVLLPRTHHHLYAYLPADQAHQATRPAGFRASVGQPGEPALGRCG